MSWKIAGLSALFWGFLIAGLQGIITGSGFDVRVWAFVAVALFVLAYAGFKYSAGMDNKYRDMAENRMGNN